MLGVKSPSEINMLIITAKYHEDATAEVTKQHDPRNKYIYSKVTKWMGIQYV